MMTSEIEEMFLALQLAARERYVWWVPVGSHPDDVRLVPPKDGGRGGTERVAGLCGGVLEGRAYGGEVPQHRCQGGLSSALTHCLWERVAEGKITALRRHSG